MRRQQVLGRRHQLIFRLAQPLACLHLAAGLQPLSALTLLNVSNDCIEDSGASALAALLPPTVENLILDNVGLSCAGGAAVARGLGRLSRLASLSLSRNRLGDEGGPPRPGRTQRPGPPGRHRQGCGKYRSCCQWGNMKPARPRARARAGGGGAEKERRLSGRLSFSLAAAAAAHAAQ